MNMTIKILTMQGKCLRKIDFCHSFFDRSYIPLENENIYRCLLPEEQEGNIDLALDSAPHTSWHCSKWSEAKNFILFAENKENIQRCLCFQRDIKLNNFSHSARLSKHRINSWEIILHQCISVEMLLACNCNLSKIRYGYISLYYSCNL